MKIRRTFLFLSLALVLGIPAFSGLSSWAGDAITNKLAENPQQTPFEVLQASFAAAASPVSLTDVDLNTNAKSNQKCSIAVLADKLPQSDWHLLRYQYTSKGIPSQGPLFPGTPDRSKEVVLAFQGDRARFDSGIGDNDSTNNLTVTTAPSGKEITEDISGFFNELKTIVLRKNGDLLSFEMVNADGSVNSYGYCYRE